MQDAGVFIRSNLVKDTWTCSRGSWEIEPAAFRLLNDPLFLLSQSPPPQLTIQMKDIFYIGAT